MPRIRLLGDAPEGAEGCEVVVSTSRALDLLRIGRAVRVADRQRTSTRQGKRARRDVAKG